MITRTAAFAVASTLTLGLAAAQSPKAEATATLDGKKITIKYSAPSVRGRKIFGDGGIISKDPNYPVWRAGANSATTLIAEGDINIGGLKVPKGTYTLFVDVGQPQWKLVVNKQTGQWGLEYHKEQDPGRVDMNMSKPAATVETFKITLAGSGNKGTLKMEWADMSGTVPVTVQ